MKTVRCISEHVYEIYCAVFLQQLSFFLLADRTNGRAIDTVLRPSVVIVVCLYGMYSD